MIAAVAAPPVAPSAAVARWPAAAAYRLQLRYVPRGGRLAGGERITFANTGPAPLRRIWLRLWPNGWHPVGSDGRGGGCRRPRVRLAGFHGARAAGYRVDCSALALDLPTALAPGARASVSFSLSVRVPVANDRFGRQGLVALIGNAIPLLAVTDGGGVHLEPYSSHGETFFSLTSAWHVVLDLPAGLRAATTGAARAMHRPGGGTRLRIEAPRARDFALAVGPFRVRSTHVDGVRVRIFATSGTSAAVARGALATARRAVHAFDRWFGRYGAPELDLVLGDFTTFGGMEYPELVFTDPYDVAVAHEVAHQWWYGIVGDDQAREPWLDESFASFAEGRLLAFPACTSDPLADYGTTRLTAPMRYFDAQPLQIGAIYRGGACALRLLRGELGAARFDAMLRAYAARYRFGVATTAGFVRAVRAAAPAGFALAAWLRTARVDTPAVAERPAYAHTSVRLRRFAPPPPSRGPASRAAREWTEQPPPAA